ncbi:ABC transporter ATP-binding protein [Actinokineospora auranticolor]|uniref:Peptide/nickel transport system ATP-binding protein n=1 Tax=Actinokineospora auranticolor TaxID=155976 RepID=A0A2S6GLT2_9PSEU|nr:ABC transporter ATP-binding protein [Actinokineospora auranticolor]PPK66177.1 peptide/nickel transport system ATP-binding protein [Actinokineospora auranticolor]
MGTEPLLAVEGLRVEFRVGRGVVEAVRGVGFTLTAGRCLAIVGESGSGKSVTARALLGLVGPGSRVSADRMELAGTDLRSLTERRWRGVRGARIGLVSQDALVSLDPLRTVGAEITEVLRNHPRPDAPTPVDLLARVHVPEPAERARQRPHELSGGLRQRALIATGLAGGPAVLIADEPTTALDVTVQAKVLALLAEERDRGMAVLLISHDLPLVASFADDVAVMRHGRIVESGPVGQVLTAPRHEYTKTLLAAMPGAAPKPPPPHREHVEALRVDQVTLAHPGADPAIRRGVFDVSFALAAGEVLGVVGESGAGKSTLAELLLGLRSPHQGVVTLGGQPWSRLSARDRRPLRRRVQLIQQDPLGSFDPRHRVERIIGDALPGPGRAARVGELLELVGLPDDVRSRHPRQLSGGQRQRVAIARALAPGPEVLVCDEPVSALDASVRARVLRLLLDLRRGLGVALVFISHDLGVVREVSDRVLVLRGGQVVEEGETERVFAEPAHEYTRELLAAVPARPAVVSRVD